MNDNVTTMPVSAVIIGSRIRRELGDVSTLAESISEVGLLHPIVVTREGRLVAGRRRLAACTKLGWTTVPVRVVDLADIRHAEAAENGERKALTASEMYEMASTLIDAERENAKTRQGARTDLSGRDAEFGRVRDRVGRFLGVSGRTVSKLLALGEAAKRGDTWAGFLAEADSTGSIDGAFRKLRDREDDEREEPSAPIVPVAHVPTTVETPVAPPPPLLLEKLALDLRVVADRFLVAHKLQPHQLTDVHAASFAMLLKDIRTHLAELEDRIVSLELTVYECDEEEG